MDETLDGKKLKNAIKASGLKVKHVAKMIGVSDTTLSSFLSGKRKLGSSAQILLLQVLNLKLEDFRKAS